MRYIYAALAALGLLAAMALPASAHHNIPDLNIGEAGECGQVALSTAWTTDTHVVANAVLVVQSGGEQQTAAVGDTIDVGPTEDETATIRYRVWGGGERDYDQPALDDLDALLAHIGGGGSPLDTDAPGVAWLTLEVAGCPVEDEDPAVEDEDPAVVEDEDPAVEDEDGTEEDATNVTPSDEDGEDVTPVAVPTAVPAGQTLPDTGAPALLALGGLGLAGAGAGLLALRRRLGL